MLMLAMLEHNQAGREHRAGRGANERPFTGVWERKGEA